MIGNVSGLLDRLHVMGAEIVRVGPDSLRVFGPGADTVPSALREELRARKGELLEHLKPHPCASCGRHLFPVSGVVCYWCRQGREHQPTGDGR